MIKVRIIGHCPDDALDCLRTHPRIEIVDNSHEGSDTHGIHVFSMDAPINGERVHINLDKVNEDDRQNVDSILVFDDPEGFKETIDCFIESKSTPPS